MSVDFNRPNSWHTIIHENLRTSALITRHILINIRQGKSILSITLSPININFVLVKYKQPWHKLLSVPHLSEWVSSGRVHEAWRLCCWRLIAFTFKSFLYMHTVNYFRWRCLHFMTVSNSEQYNNSKCLLTLLMSTYKRIKWLINYGSTQISNRCTEYRTCGSNTRNESTSDHH
jgi:hypothetical protein